MKLKKGVSLVGLHTKMQISNCFAAVICSKYGQELFITCAIEPRPPGSLHPFGRACDYRMKYFKAAIRKLILAELQECLGNDYDVLLHGKGARIHIHCEYDPDNPKII